MDNFSQTSWNGFESNSHDFKETMMNFKKGKVKAWGIVVIIVALLAFVLSPLYHMLMEYWQIEEIGSAYTSLYITNLTARAITQSVGFILIFLILLVNVFIVKKIGIEPNFSARFLQKKWPYVLLCLIFALSLSNLAGGNLYQKFLLATNGQKFNTIDPLFGQDVGYYMFLRPFLISLVNGGKSLLLLLMVIAMAVYLIIFIKNGHKSLREIVVGESEAVIHVVSLAILYFLLSMFTYKFSAENLLFSTFGAQNEIFGAGYVEANIWRHYYTFAPFVVGVSIALVVLFLYRKKYWLSLLSLGVLPVFFLVMSVVTSATDSFIVSPNERNLQSTYIAHNIEATRHAFGLDAVSETEFVPQYNLSQEVIGEDDTWLAGTRIADFGSTLTAYNQLQFLRKYYSFYDVDVAPYELDGKQNVVFLAAREMNKENLDSSAKSYANQIFRYTHGFGAVASPVNRVTEEGQPEFLIRDIPPVSTGGMPTITQPRIYYGELTNDYVIVGAGNKELDYSEGLEDIEFTYDGDSGVTLNFFKRLMFAWHYKDYRMLFSGNIDGESRLLLNRNVLDRVGMVAPFISLDDDPYLVISDDGNLYWIVNGYTTSSHYPYAQPYDGINYIRNSVTAVVSAYTGDVALYLTDPTDPIACAYRNIYPKLFAGETLPDGIANHIRVPEALFNVQSHVYQQYHVQDAGQFYDRADVWDIATEKYQDNEIPMAPYYNIMEIDGADEMVLMRPFVIQGKYNMVSLLVQRNAPDHYGELILFRFPKNETVYGPMQIENRIDNDPDISREMTLWGQGGSSVIRGNLLVVPFRNSLLYVEPVYITSHNNASLPELKRIVVSYGERIAMEPTLEGALRSVFAAEQDGSNGNTENPETSPLTNQEVQGLEAAVDRLLEAYDRLQESTRMQDWRAMGENMDELEEKMEALREQQNTIE
ncbi:MAG: hypothetical protein E7393_04275 [Ruminococcaceae bacterium]|nr:hypothetical protein [Oscillospiraceae bacterium]